MARKRMIDPSFWTDPHVAKLSREERLFFLGCISAADDEGRLLGSPAFLRARIFPYDEELTVEQMRAMRDQVLDLEKNLILYEKAGVEYMAFLRWGRYQKPSHPTASKLPPPPNLESSRSSPETPAKGSREDRSLAPSCQEPRLGKDRLGKDSIGNSKNRASDSQKESREKEIRKETVAAFVRLYTPSPPGVEVPYHEYPSAAILDDVDLLAVLWGDGPVQDAIRAAVAAGKTKVGPKYISAILKRWHKEGNIEPLMTEREFEHYEQTR